MSQNSNQLFSIGQFASMHHINKKTLMWYDEIGLFKPAVVRENGYRYYTYQQCYTLETILMLRELNISIPEIQSFIEHRSAASLQTVLSEKAEEIDHTIKHFTQIKKALIQQKQGLENLQTIDLSSISLIEKSEQKLVILRNIKGISPEEETELLLNEAHRHKEYRMYGILYGSMIPTSSLYRHDFDDYQAFFLKIPEAEITKNIHIQPARTYLCAYCRGSWDKLPQRYREILEYAANHQIELVDYAYETGINEMVIGSVEEYITQIEIPIKK